MDDANAKRVHDTKVSSGIRSVANLCKELEINRGGTLERILRGGVIAAVLLLSIGCRGIDVGIRDDDPALVATPSPASSTSGITPVMTDEPTARATAAPTDAPQLLPTHTKEAIPLSTPAPKVTPQASVTATVATSASVTLLPTPTPMPTLPARQGILSFAANPNPVQRGGTVTLAWDTSGVVGASITRMSEDGDILLETEALDLRATGSLTVQVPVDYVESVKYYLGGRSASGARYEAYATVWILCPYDPHLAPRCPLTRKQVWAAYESFERGHMVWREDTREITVLYDDGSYESYQDTWQEGDPVDIPGSPPPGRFAPVRGFGHLYADQSHIRERLGWATTAEVGYTMTVETLPGGSGLHRVLGTYFTLPDSRVISLYPYSSTWHPLP
jgi:hypothetical protein